MAIAVACCVALVGSGLAAAGSAATLSATLGNGHIVVTGKDFPAQAVVKIKASFGTDLYSSDVTASKTGAFEHAIPIPQNFSGMVKISASARVRVGATTSSTTAITNTTKPQQPPLTTAPTTPAPTTTATTVKPITTTPSSTSAPTNPASAAGIWKPLAGTKWQWQLTGTIDLSIASDVYDIDGENATAATVSSIHAKGAKAICYFSAGSYENYRSDASKFPSGVLGKVLDGWPDEKWLDIRQIDALKPVMTSRIEMCKQKGFDGIEPDNIDAYTNSTGFPLTAADQSAYNKFLADTAHANGLAAFLKNDLDQASQLQPYFEGAINEQCFQYGECDSLSVFINANKPVFEAEYDLSTLQFCSKANSMKFSSIKKNLDLDAKLERC